MLHFGSHRYFIMILKLSASESRFE